MTVPESEVQLPVYLGPELPRWQPSALTDVQMVIDDGSLRERHWLDVKALLVQVTG